MVFSGKVSTLLEQQPARAAATANPIRSIRMRRALRAAHFSHAHPRAACEGHSLAVALSRRVGCCVELGGPRYPMQVVARAPAARFAEYTLRAFASSVPPDAALLPN